MTCVVKDDGKMSLQIFSEAALFIKVWHPTRWWSSCMLEVEKKEINPTFTDKVGNC